MKYRSRYDIIRFLIDNCKDESIAETRALQLAGTNPSRWQEIRKEAFDHGVFEKTADGRIKATRKALTWAQAWDHAKDILNLDNAELEAQKTGSKPKRKSATSKAVD